MSTMDLVSRELAPASAGAEENPGESPVCELIRSPFAEISASTALGLLEGAISRKRSGLRPKRISKLRRRKLQQRRRSVGLGEVIVGTLAGINDDGQPLVRHPLGPSEQVILARSTVPILPEHIDREVVLAFECDDPSRPIVLGVLRRSDAQEPPEPRVAPPVVSRPIVQATLDGEQLVLTAEQKIVLRCGKASLTLTRAGKILIRGTYLLSRSSGVNRIKGGSVQIN